MKGLIGAAVAAVALSGCIAVPAPYPDAYYYPAPAIGVGVYAAPAYRHPHYYPRRYYGYRY